MMTAAARKYLITLWEDSFDIDGLTNEFAILGEFNRLEDAKSRLKPLAEQLMAEELAKYPGWFPMELRVAPKWCEVNIRDVLAREAFKVGDGTGFNSTYVYLEVIGTLADEPVSANLFNLKNCRPELEDYFRKQKRLKGLI
jgi:hypothetical protein